MQKEMHLCNVANFSRLGALTGIAAVSASLPARAMPCRKDWGLSAIHLTALNLKPEDLAIQAHRAGYSAIGIRIESGSLRGSVGISLQGRKCRNQSIQEPFE